MHYLVAASGDAAALPAVAELPAFDLIVCADGGAHNAAQLGLQPDVVIGDMDSLGAVERARLERQGCRFIVHPVAKDETDLELALLWCKQHGADRITVVGALGDRPDHTLANLMLLCDRRLAGIDIRVRARRWEMAIVRSALDIEGHTGDLVSLIPISWRAMGVETDGLAYALHNETLRRGPARGVSNVMTCQRAQVRLRSGLLMVMHGQDGAAG